MNKTSASVNMTRGKPSEALTRFAVPIILSNILQQLYNIIDSLVAGKFLGGSSLAAIGSTGSIVTVLVQVSAGLALGASVVIAQYYGAGKLDKIRVCGRTMAIFCAGAGVVVTILVIVFAAPLLRLIKTPDTLMAPSLIYLRVYFSSAFAAFVYNAYSACYIAIGNSRKPLYYLIAAFLINVVGDLSFVLIFHMREGGIALSSAIAQYVCMILAMIDLPRELSGNGIPKTRIFFNRQELGLMLKIALPAALQMSVVSVGNVMLQTTINTFGAIVIAGCTAANKVVNLVTAVTANIGDALSTYVAQNIGANQYNRIGQGIKAALKLGVSISLVMTAVLEIWPGQVIGFFIDFNNKEEAGAVLRVGVAYLRVVAAFFVLFAVFMAVKNVFKGSGDMMAFLMTTVGSLGVRVACAMILCPLFGETMIWWSLAIGWITATIPTIMYYYSGRWKRSAIV